MRQLTGHIVEVDPINSKLKIEVLGGPDKVCFQITGSANLTIEPGVTNEALLAIIIDRLRGRCSDHEAVALVYCERAQAWLRSRVIDKRR